MNAAELLDDLTRLGIRFEADGERLRYYPRSALTPDLLDRLKASKADLLALLKPTHDVAPAIPLASRDARETPAKAICRCGSATWRDVPIHGGQSTRRDCAGCGRFIGFPVWYGKEYYPY